MFPSAFHVDTIVPKLHSSQTLRKRSQIDLNFGRHSGGSRRMSFLPASWNQESRADKYKSSGSSVYNTKGIEEETLIREFCTGSKYTGENNKLGISGKGIYKYPHGVIYDGFFNKNGEFHGSGTLIYPNGQKVEGIWRNGRIMKGAHCVNADDVPFANHYCKMPDRRFQIEVDNDLSPAGQEYLTNAPNPPRTVPPECYDSGNGFYNPTNRVIYDYTDPKSMTPLSEMANIDPVQRELYNKILKEASDSQEYILNQLRLERIERVPSIKLIPVDVLEKWILDNCRKDFIGTVGWRPKLYEDWTSGKRSEDCSKTEYINQLISEDNLVNEIATIFKTGSGKSSTLVSFIMIPDDPKINKDSVALSALSKMFLQKNDKNAKNIVVKKGKFLHAKKHRSKITSRLSPTSKNKQEDAMHFLEKLKAKFREAYPSMDF